MKRYLKLFRLSLIPVLVFSACSCAVETTLENVLGTSSEAPVFMEYRAISREEVDFRFSLPVQVVSLSFDPPCAVETVVEGSTVKAVFQEALQAGAKLTADLVVEDEGKNSLNVVVPFRARNDNMPPLVINELRTRYESKTNKAEFIELLSKEAGNLGALRLFIAGVSLTQPVYEFPSVDVQKGEYIVLHLRIFDAEKDLVANEIEPDDLALSQGSDDQDTARDFWTSLKKKPLHDTDAIWIMDQDDRIIDGVLLCENSVDWGSNKTIAALMPAAAEFLARQGAWFPPSGSPASSLSPADAFITEGATVNRTINRDESMDDNNTRSNWYISDHVPSNYKNPKPGYSPGMPNNTDRYSP